MVDSVKITALQDIGANIAYTTLVPVVNMAGTPETQKATLQNVGNLILGGAGGAYFPRVAQANIALSVANAAQPNITSVGTLTSLNVVGNLSVSPSGVINGNASGLNNIPGANVVGSVPTAILAGTVTTAAQPNITSVGTLTSLAVTGGGVFGSLNGGNIVSANFFVGDGGLLSNITATSSYGNSNVSNYLPAYNGDLNPNTVNVSGNLYVSSVVASNANVVISADADNINARWTFTGGGALHLPAPPGQLWAIEPNIDNEFEIKSTSNIVISTDIANSNSHFTFDSNGVFTAPSNVNLLGSRLNVGPDAATAANLLHPTLVIANTGAQFIQAAILNNDGAGSADLVSYGAGGSDLEAWADLGYAGFSFNDANYTITAPGDGYVFVQGYVNGTGGNLVIATGENGNGADIVFATGGFLTSNEFARIDHTNSLLHFTRAGSGIKFNDNTVQDTAGIVWTTAPVSNTSPGVPGQAAYDTGGNLFVCVATNTWSKFSGTTSW